MRHAWATLRVLFPLALLTAAAVPAGFAAGYNYKAIAYLDTPAPGGKNFVNDFEPGAISDKGELAFIVDYDTESSEGLYLATEQGLITIVEPGKPATDGWSFVADGPIGMIIGPVSMNAAGDISFGADIKQGDTISSANFLWRRSNQTLEAIQLPGQDAPGGGKFGIVPGQAWTSLNDMGDVLFSVQVPNPDGEQELGLFLRTADGKMSAIVRPGDKSPEGGVFRLPRRARGTMNLARQIAFRANVTKDGNTWTGIYLWQDGKISPLITLETDAPGGGKFQEALDPRINNKGQIAFLGRTAGGLGLYLLDGGKIQPIASPGQDLPGGGKLETAVTRECTHALANSGSMAMLLDLAEGGRGAYAFRDGSLQVVARPGMDLPGIGTLENAETCAAVGNLGHVAFQANLKDGKIALVLATPTP
jgi:hypothetical protein